MTKNMKIVTLTLNPAYDVHVQIGEFRAGHENLADSVSRDIGGKGVNISRALRLNSGRLGTGTGHSAFVILGEDNAADFREGLENEDIDTITLTVPGRIRENITIHPAEGGETRLSFKGFTCPTGTPERVKELISVGSGDILTFTGSLPGGIGKDAAISFLKDLTRQGVRVVIDSKSISPSDLREIKPWLIKPNAEEIFDFFGKDADRNTAPDEKLLEKTALDVAASGIENVMISLGGDGAILASDGKLWRAKNPKIDAISTIGAGDSSIAGFITAFSRNASKADCLREAVTYGTAACLTEGTNPPRPDDIKEIHEKVTVTVL
ncbi:MAG: hexose kinase [Clostridiales bacterium]|nr:hexose kinase [Clostridiales bacterium]